MRRLALCCAAFLLASAPDAHAQAEAPAPVPLVDVPYISQSEALCGGAAAAMVLRFWGARELSAESFSHLVDRSAAGIGTAALIDDLRRRGWNAGAIRGDENRVRAELAQGRPVLALIEDRPGALHYLVVVAWTDRGIVFHDPARAPFRVMARTEFERRWKVTDQWMAVVVPGSGIRGPGPGGSESSSEPGASDPGASNPGASNPGASNPGASNPGASDPSASDPGSRIPDPGTAALSCERLVAEGVRFAQANDLAVAERALTTALPCPGSSAARELAGVRLLQQRWSEVADLASSVLAQDPRDEYAWRLLATSRFVQDDRAGALDAWNKAGEPRVDLIQIDGLTRTTHRAVERVIGAERGVLLTSGGMARAQRRLAELPSAFSARLDYVPVPSGLTELRGAVAERPLFPARGLSVLAIGVMAAASRELRVTTGSLTGNGEGLSVSWRFWPHRPRFSAALRSPAPWNGIWEIGGFTERQTLDVVVPAELERSGARLGVSDWATGAIRWQLEGGIDRWRGRSTLGNVGAVLRVEKFDDRFEPEVRVTSWIGEAPFAAIHVSARMRSSEEPRGTVLTAAVAVEGITRHAPVDVWPAVDSGHARSTLMRAHPLLDDGRLQLERAGRALANVSLEAQRWWQANTFVRVGGAVFSDLSHIARRATGGSWNGVDVGVGARVAVTGMPGLVRVDLAKGLSDGRTALSVVYQP